MLMRNSNRGALEILGLWFSTRKSTTRATAFTCNLSDHRTFRNAAARRPGRKHRTTQFITPASLTSVTVALGASPVPTVRSRSHYLSNGTEMSLVFKQL